jgi:hypothetical protein
LTHVEAGKIRVMTDIDVQPTPLAGIFTVEEAGDIDLITLAMLDVYGLFPEIAFYVVRSISHNSPNTKGRAPR